MECRNIDGGGRSDVTQRALDPGGLRTTSGSDGGWPIATTCGRQGREAVAGGASVLRDGGSGSAAERPRDSERRGEALHSRSREQSRYRSRSESRRVAWLSPQDPRRIARGVSTSPTTRPARIEGESRFLVRGSPESAKSAPSHRRLHTRT